MCRFYNIVNVILQIYLLTLFLGINFFEFGYESVSLFRYGLNQPESKYFPRETFCDFQVREPLRADQPLQRITVQCVLTVNLFNQVNFRCKRELWTCWRNMNIHFSANIHSTLDVVYGFVDSQSIFVRGLDSTFGSFKCSFKIYHHAIGANKSRRNSSISFQF